MAASLWPTVGVLVVVPTVGGLLSWLGPRFSHRFNRPIWFVIGSTLALLIINASFSIWLHTHYQSHGHDLGIFDQAIWELSRWQEPATTVRITPLPNIFGDHFHPLLVALAPLYWLFNSPLVLLMVQAIAFASVIPLTFMLAGRFNIGKWYAAILSVAFGLNPGLALANGFDFHEIALAIPLILLVFWAAFSDRQRWYWIFIGLLLLTKETMGIYVALIGITWLCLKKWRVGMITLFIGLIYFILATRIFIPHFAPTTGYSYWKQYEHLAASSWQMPAQFVRHPIQFVHELFNDHEKIRTLSLSLGSVGFVPLFSPWMWPTTLALFAERFWAATPTVWEYSFHYQALAAVFMAISVLLFLRWLPERWRRIGIPLCACLVVAGIVVTNFIANPWARWNDKSIESLPTATWSTELIKIPRSASVAAQDTFVPHLAHRSTIYQFPRIRDAEYIVLDPLAPSWPLSKDQIVTWQVRLRADTNWTLTTDIGSLTIFRRLNYVPLTDPAWPEWE